MTRHHGTASGSDRVHGTNPVAAIAIHAALTGLLLTLALQAGMPLVAGAALAWAGGACATVALLLAHDAAIHRRPDVADRSAPATVPDL